MPTPPEIQAGQIIIYHMANIITFTQLTAHDYITGEKRGMYVGRKRADEFAVGERWSYEYEGETATNIGSQICVKHARKYVYFAHRLLDAGNPSRITKVPKTRMITYSIGLDTFEIVAPWSRALVAPAPVLPAPVAPAPVEVKPTTDTCPVCLTDYDLKDMAETVCHHNFCDACAMKLYRTGQTACPMCRTALQFKMGTRV